MTVVDIQVGSPVNDIDEAWRSLGNTGLVRREMGRVLDEGARVGEESMKIYAPERTRRLKRAIGRTHSHATLTGAMEARTGVGRVESAGLGEAASRDYPYMVHEGTGLFGKFARLITPRTAKYMVFEWRGRVQVRKTVAGQRPQPFVREAYADVIGFVSQRVDLMVRNILNDRSAL